MSTFQLFTCVFICTGRQYNGNKFVIFQLAKLCLLEGVHLPGIMTFCFIYSRYLALEYRYLFHDGT